jgi:phosphoserine phosphatase
MTEAPATLLVTLTGPDRPGVTSALFQALAGTDVVVLDMEQVVIRGTLVLGVLLGGPDVVAAEEMAVLTAHRLGMALATNLGEDETDPRRLGRLNVTLLGHPLVPSAVAGIAGRIAATGANIDRIVRLASYPVTSIELEVSGADPDLLGSELAAEATSLRAGGSGVDVAVQRAGLTRRAKRLVMMDVDSTLIQDEVIDLLAARAGCENEVAAMTAAAMDGDLDFAESLRDRVALLAGLPVATVTEVCTGVRLTPGARTLVRILRRLGYRTGVVSGGFTQVTDHLTAELGLDYAVANRLEIDSGVLTGRVEGPVVGRHEKARALEDFAGRHDIPMAQTVAIGDGANDLEMLGRAGLGIAFNAKPTVRAAADTSVNVPYLDTILYLLGISREEVEAADSAG